MSPIGRVDPRFDSREVGLDLPSVQSSPERSQTAYKAAWRADRILFMRPASFWCKIRRAHYHRASGPWFSDRGFEVGVLPELTYEFRSKCEKGWEVAFLSSQ